MKSVIFHRVRMIGSLWHRRFFVWKYILTLPQLKNPFFKLWLLSGLLKATAETHRELGNGKSSTLQANPQLRSSRLTKYIPKIPHHLIIVILLFHAELIYCVICNVNDGLEFFFEERSQPETCTDCTVPQMECSGLWSFYGYALTFERLYRIPTLTSSSYIQKTWEIAVRTCGNQLLWDFEPQLNESEFARGVAMSGRRSETRYINILNTTPTLAVIFALCLRPVTYKPAIMTTKEYYMGMRFYCMVP